jgi:hypothetical protein
MEDKKMQVETHSGTTDVPVTQEGDTNENQEKKEVAESKETTE